MAIDPLTGLEKVSSGTQAITGPEQYQSGQALNNNPTAPDPAKISMPGLIAAPVMPYEPAKTTAVTANIDQNAGTVAGRVKGLIEANDPIQQLAITRAKQESAAMGQNNSSQAVGAAMDAAYRAAIPIAAADAAATNQFALTNAGAQNVANASNTDAINQARLFGAQTTAQAQASDRQMQHDTALQAVKGAQSVELANIETANRAMLQKSDSASKFFTSIVSAVAIAESSTALNAADREKAIVKLTDMLKAGMSIISTATSDAGIGVDLASLLSNIGTESAAIPAQQATSSQPVTQNQQATSPVVGRPSFPVVG